MKDEVYVLLMIVIAFVILCALYNKMVIVTIAEKNVGLDKDIEKPKFHGFVTA